MPLRTIAKAKSLLDDLCSAVSKLFIVIDGLDECEPGERKQTLQNIMKITCTCNNDAPGKLRVLVVSQDYPDIRKLLHSSEGTGIPPKIIQISDIDNEDDIKTYTGSLVEQIALKFVPFTEDMKAYLRDLTVANAKGIFTMWVLGFQTPHLYNVGMFLYASLVLQNLLSQPTREMLLNAIKRENFPDGLKAAWVIL